jgi:hypothetical protein
LFSDDARGLKVEGGGIKEKRKKKEKRRKRLS